MATFVMCGCIAAATPASASPITFTFSGKLDTADFGFSVGDPFSGRYTFESTAGDEEPAPDFGEYRSSGVPYTFTAFVKGLPVYSYTAVTIRSLTDAATWSQYDASSTFVDAALTTQYASEIVIFAGLSLLTGEALPLVPPPVSPLPAMDPLVGTPFARWSFFVITASGIRAVSGPLTTLTLAPVPEPSSLVLMGIGLTVVVRHLRRKRTGLQ
jgi:hypothetical protein